MVHLHINEHLHMRTLEPGDAHVLFHAVDTSRAHLRKWLHWVDLTTKEADSLEFIMDAQRQQDTQQGLVLGIFLEDELIGTTGMHHWEQDLKKAQIGYWICKDHEGKGTMHRCIAAFIRFLFEQAGLNKIEIHFVAQNKRSAALAEKLGFKTEGYLRQSILRNGMLADLVITGLLRSEWKP